METTTTQSRRLVLAVADIAGFARRCKTLDDQEVLTALDRFYEAVGEQAAQVGGTVVKCIGDAVLMTFPIETAQAAVTALSEMRSILNRDAMNPILKGGEVHVRIHCGPVACGEIGPKGAKRYDVIGNAVNELFMIREKGVTISPAMQDLLAESH